MRSIPDPLGLSLPDALPERAGGAVEALGRVTAVCGEALSLLDRVEACLPASSWSGAAATSFGQRRRVLGPRVEEVAQLAAVASSLLDRWSGTAALERGAMSVAKDRLEAVRAAEAAGQRTGVLPAPALLAEHDAAQREWQRARAAYWDGLTQVTDQLGVLRDSVSDRPVSFGEHLGAFAHTVWDRGVVEPVGFGWSLTGQVITDPGGWWRDVSALPGAAVTSVGELVTDPLGVAGDVVDVDAWRQGHIGEGLGAIAALGVPGPKGLRAARIAGHVVQSVDDLLKGVDLLRHEGPELGHTLERHVNVDDAYLEVRMVLGTLQPDGMRSFIPPSASRFTDQATAEAAITEVLQANAAQVRTFAAGGARTDPRLELVLSRDVGVVVRYNVYGVLERCEGRKVVVNLARNGGGNVYVATAFVDVVE